MSVPWTARRSNQSTLKEIIPDYSLEGLMLKLKLQYPGHLMGRVNLLEKTLMVEKIESRRKRGQERMEWLDGITDSAEEFEQASGDSEGQGSLVCCSPWGHKELDTIEELNIKLSLDKQAMTLKLCNHKHIIFLPDLNIDSNQMYALSAENLAIQMACEHCISIEL